MLYTEEAVRAGIRVRDGRRVFYLGSDDRLTPAAKEWLRGENIGILPKEAAAPPHYTTLFGGVLTEKPEHMTHLRENVLVFKDHPRIRFRGMVDSLEAELLLCGRAVPEKLKSAVKELLDLTRRLLRAEVLEEPLPDFKLCGMDADELRERSHFPAKYYGQPHFMPEFSDPDAILLLNRVRTAVRQTELAAYAAFKDRDGMVQRSDILTALNRMSSLCWILMIQCKKEGTWISTNSPKP